MTHSCSISKGPSRTPQDERTLNFDIQMIPIDWLEVDAGVGRSEEREPEREKIVQEVTEPTDVRTDEVTSSLQTANATIRNNFNWGVNFNRRSGGGIAPLTGVRANTRRRQARDEYRRIGTAHICGNRVIEEITESPLGQLPKQFSAGR